MSHVNIFALIAQTSFILKKARKADKKKVFPDCITEIQMGLSGKKDCAEVVQFVQEFNTKYARG